jgi:outer membrane biogenesis lipoprotein LolB
MRKMKFIILLCVIFLGGCAQLATGQAPDKPRQFDAAHNQLIVECNGYANEFSVCFQAAKEACPAGYVVDDRLRNLGSVARAIIFRCN